MHLGAESSETCNTYNMLKLTRHLFGWLPSADLMDFYERGLYNHILASQDPATGGVIYYCPLKPGAFKTFSTPNDAFWCCVGTGMENPARYTDAIYFAGDQSLFVNLFMPSELTWRDQRPGIEAGDEVPRAGLAEALADAQTARAPVVADPVSGLGARWHDDRHQREG